MKSTERTSVTQLSNGTYRVSKRTKTTTRGSGMSKGMFPKPFWLSHLRVWKPIMLGSDEWGRHTICVGIPWLVHLVIPWRICPQTGECAELAQFACTFPGCPYVGMSIGGTCMAHDEEFWQEIEDEGAV